MGKVLLYHDNFQNYKRYGIPKAQLVIADVPYNLGANAYASNPEWYNGGDNKKGESKKAAKPFFNGDGDFNLVEYFHFLLKTSEKGAERTRESAVYDYILFVSASGFHYSLGCKIRVSTLHTACIR